MVKSFTPPNCKYMAVNRFVLRSASHQKEELVDWLALSTSANSTSKVLLPAVRRSFIHKNNLLHRGIGAILLRVEYNGDIAVFVHKRASSKRLFPSMWDMFIGGVSVSGESPISTLFRELEEECGLELSQECSVKMELVKPVELNSINGVNKINLYDTIHKIQNREFSSSSEASAVLYVGDTFVKTALNHCLVSCFLVFLSTVQSERIMFRDGEIESGSWKSLAGLETTLLDHGDEDFVPDGMQVK